MKGYGVFNEKKDREEDESYVPRKDNKSEGESTSVKVALCNEYNIDSYKGLTMFDDAGGGSEVGIMNNINDETILDACKGLPTLEVGKIRLLKALRQVRVLALNPRMVVQQINRIRKMIVHTHLTL